MTLLPDDEQTEIATRINEKVERAKLEIVYTENLRKISNPITSDEE